MNVKVVANSNPLHAIDHFIYKLKREFKRNHVGWMSMTTFWVIKSFNWNIKAIAASCYLIEIDISVTYFSLVSFLPKIKSRLNVIYKFFKNKWYIDEIYQNPFLQSVGASDAIQGPLLLESLTFDYSMKACLHTSKNLLKFIKTHLLK